MNPLTSTLMRVNRVAFILGIVSLVTIFVSANAGFTFSPAAGQILIVTNTNDQGSGSLRDAIANANATLDPDTIVFDIPGAGVKTINLLSSLPDITDPIVIDATTQPGYAGAPLVELDGLAAGANGNGLVIKAVSTVRGLAIVNFTNNGIWLNACNNNTIKRIILAWAQLELRPSQILAGFSSPIRQIT